MAKMGTGSTLATPSLGTKTTLLKLLVKNVLQKLPSIRYFELLQNLPTFLSEILQCKVSSKEFLMPKRRKFPEKKSEMVRNRMRPKLLFMHLNKCRVFKKYSTP